MQFKKYLLFLLLAVALLVTGCSMDTVDKMYCLPGRSEDYKDLQSAIDSAMDGLEYCAPLSGENQQTVQTADLDGDRTQEYLLFAKGGDQQPLRILIFDEINGTYTHVDTIQSNGFAFDLVEYVQMDSRPGVELVVGCQLSDQLIRSVSVYKYVGGKSEKLITTNYTRFVTVDLTLDGNSDLFVLRPGQTDTENGIAELYSLQNEQLERSNEVSISCPADKLKRIVCGKLYDGEPAVYVASAVEDTALITDVYAFWDSTLKNVSLSNESGTSVKTLRNYYVYADDIDNDGVVELPDLITMVPFAGSKNTDRHDLIRWYSMRADGSEVDKIHTYHNFISGWYMELDPAWASRVSVNQQGIHYEFHIMDDHKQESHMVFSVYALFGADRDREASANGNFVLLKTESVTYCARVYDYAENFGITQELLIRSFRLIQRDWKTGET